MKAKLFFIFIGLFLICSCNLDDNSIGGEPSVMGNVGESVSSFGNNLVKDANATVTSLEDGVSTFTGYAEITDPAILNVISKIPEFKVNGNKVSISGMKFKITKDGIESMNSAYPGIIVDYGSKVGDTYKGGNGIERKVIHKSTEDEYSYGFFDIKVIKVEESPATFTGVKKIVYIANHKFGLVGIEVTLDDNTTKSFGILGSSENG